MDEARGTWLNDEGSCDGADAKTARRVGKSAELARWANVMAIHPTKRASPVCTVSSVSVLKAMLH